MGGLWSLRNISYLINSSHIEFERVHCGDESLNTLCYADRRMRALRIPEHHHQFSMSGSSCTSQSRLHMPNSPGLAMLQGGWHP